MSEHLPEFVDPRVMAEKRRRFSGAFPFARMARLMDQILCAEGAAQGELEFGKDGRYATVTGKVEADISVQCQCCLAPIRLAVRSMVSLAVVSSLDEVDRLPEHYEPLLLEGDRVALSDIVEDELLLAIPAVPQHEKCETPVVKAPKAESADFPAGPVNPFAILAELKNKTL